MTSNKSYGLQLRATQDAESLIWVPQHTCGVHAASIWVFYLENANIGRLIDGCSTGGVVLPFDAKSPMSILCDGNSGRYGKIQQRKAL